MRLAVIGCGALGSLFAAALSSQAELLMLGHWPQQMSRLRTNGLTLIGPDGSQSRHLFKVTDDPAVDSPVDLALVLVKSYQTARTAFEVKQLLAHDGLAITLQNGLGNARLLAEVLGPDRVTQGITALGAAVEEPGVVRLAGYGPTHLVQPAGKLEPLQKLAVLMNASGFETHLTSDLQGLTWGKLVINSSINPLTALLRVPNGFLASNDQARELMLAAAQETVAVAQALNIDLPYPDASQRVVEVAQMTAGNRSSMLQDVLRGSQTEIDAISGAVVRHGRSIGVAAPINAEFLRLIQHLPALRPGEPLLSTLGPLQSLLTAHSKI